MKDYPKDREFRRFKLTGQIAQRSRRISSLRNSGERPSLPLGARTHSKPKLRLAPDPFELGLTEPNDKGRSYRHGTLSAYTAGKCRCEPCRAAFAIYRAGRRSSGKDNPREPRQRETDCHIPADWFRRQIWKPALTEADLGINVRIHDMRHAHASWLLAGGADLQVVKERLGHASIATTEKYLHTLDDAEEAALDAFSKIRNRSSR
ncbi:tyrosine-type recombinase/integrase [Nonomuraea jabiensis]|uniref:tyrosine-type recombinase/integrase n=1 Tax=Nonomuraea jabiensis TaxID=882448 RepID=UPI003D7170CA